LVERAIYNPTTTDDPIMEQLSESNAATVFVTDSILSMMMCANRSVYPWDIVVVRDGDKVYFDKRPNSSFDYVTVNENAVEPPPEVVEGTKDQINTAGQLSLEATVIINNFAQQCLKESPSEKYEFQNPNPFNVDDEDPETLASRGYRYRKFNLSPSDQEDPVTLIVRTEVDGVIRSATGESQFVTIKALNEFDKSQHAIDWRSKLDSQRGAVVATEMKNNSCKLARWALQSILADAAYMKIGYVSRLSARDNTKHVILAVGTYKPKDFASQMNVQLANAWGIVRAIVDMCRKRPDGKYVLVKVV
jgi:translation initiation factor 3 subunit D